MVVNQKTVSPGEKLSVSINGKKGAQGTSGVVTGRVLKKNKAGYVIMALMPDKTSQHLLEVLPEKLSISPHTKVVNPKFLKLQ